MHRNVAVQGEKLTQQARGRREKKAHVRLAKFALGDFELFGNIIQFLNKLALRWKGRVKWKGLDEEASWEPALQLYEDIAVVLRRWIVKNASDGVAKEMRDDLEATLGHPL
ncbi:hypothetical protein DYB35_012807 [Aphanomyces astaci]|uniref:Chromo domain-containing protein n=1 Tax=Aphanomyces astaci TaxID=112090 RepID=A0A418DUY2_APHAT|nr:hypothetical protein DYB35_012807 [Aphanomyces astaci]